MAFDITSFVIGKNTGGGGGGGTIVSKTITANGTYSASADNADGYSPVTVSVSGGNAWSTAGVVIDDSVVAEETSVKEVTA